MGEGSRSGTGQASSGGHARSRACVRARGRAFAFSLALLAVALLVVCGSASAATGAISGRVTDALTSEPVEDTAVCVYESDGDYVGCEWTDADGEYTVSGLPSGHYKVSFRAEAESYVEQFYNDKSSLATADSVTVTSSHTTTDVDAALHEGDKISGKVTSAGGGAGIASAYVCAIEAADEYGDDYCAETNGSGEYAILDLPSGEYKVRFDEVSSGEDHYLAQYYHGEKSWESAEVVSVTATEATTGIDAALQEAGKITGKVTKAAGGGALESVDVCAYDSEDEYEGFCAYTNPGGEYSIAGLDEGSYKVEFSPPFGTEYVSQYYDGKSTSEEADLVAVSPEVAASHIDAALRKGGKIEGKVTKAAGGTAISGLQVCAYEVTNSYYPESHCTTTESNGKYAIHGLKAVSYKVDFNASNSSLNYVNQYYHGVGTLQEAEEIAVGTEATVTGINASMVEGGEIEGKVTKAGGAALSGISVCAEAYNYCGYTNSSGEYLIMGLPTGSYDVVFHATGNYLVQYYNGKASGSEADPVTVTGGAVTPNIDAQMHEGGQIQGKVTAFTGGVGIDDVYVCAQSSSPGHEYESWCGYTNSAGEYSILAVPAGSYTVEFEAPYGGTYISQYYNGKSSAGEATSVSVTEEVVTSSINAKLHEGGQIKGKVTATTGGAPIEEVDVCAYNAASEYESHCVLTGASGEYAITGLPTGQYKVRFYPRYGAGNYVDQYYDGEASFAEAEPVSVTQEAVTSSINAQLESGGQIKGKVTKATGGATLEEIEVCADDVSAGPYEGEYACAQTNSEGRYTLEGLPTGNYRVEFSDPAGTYLRQYYDGKATYGEAEAVAVSAGSTTANIDVQMHEGGQIQGTVTKASGGAALRGIEVCAYKSESESEYEDHCDETDSSGNYTIHDLPTGQYSVVFEPSGGANYLIQYYSGKTSYEEAERVSVTQEDVTVDIDAQMHEGGQIKGKATKAGGGALEDITVCVYASGSYEYGYDCATTNGAGEYTISGLPTGSYKVGFSGTYGAGVGYLTQYYDGKSSLAEAEPVTVTAGSATTGVDAQMQEGGQIKGKVTKAAGGAAVSGAFVCAYPATGSSSESRCASANTGGEYTITALATGSYKVEFEGSSSGNYLTSYYNGKATWAEADPVAVTAGSTTAGINGQLQAGGQIKGKVTKASGGGALGGIEVCESPVIEESGGYSENCVITNSGGEYTISALATGNYKVGFSPEYGNVTNYVSQYYDGKATLAEADPVAVTAGSTTADIDAQMHEGAQIKGTVTAAAGGAAIEDAEVCAYESGIVDPTTCAYANTDGRYVIAGLPAGSYQVGFGPGYECGAETCVRQNYAPQFYSGQASRAGAETIALGAGETREGIDASMQEGGRISGTVTDASNGHPVEGATVCAFRSGETESEACTGSGADGTYVLSGLSAGPHKVSFEPGEICNVEGCHDQSYATQYYNHKASLASADAVSVTLGGNTANINAAMAAPTVAKPVNTVAPVLSGTPVVGQTLSCSQGSWSNSPASYETAWLRDGSVISGQAGSTYMVQGEDAGHQITCRITASNTGGATAAVSNALSVPAKPANTAAPHIVGTVVVGEEVSCDPGTWTGSPTFTYVWLRDGSVISGQTTAHHAVQSADAGRQLSCAATATNGSGSTEATSAGVHVPAKPVNTVAPSVTGTPAVGQTLTCNPGTWEHSPTFTYVWLRGSTPIGGQTMSTYQVQAADQGQGIACEVTASNSDGTAAKTSAPVSVPAAPGAPVNTTPPSIHGVAALNETLTCEHGVWTEAPTSYEYAWSRSGAPISGASGTTYVVQAADAGTEISCSVTAKNGEGSNTATSAPVSIPAKPVSSAKPQITGTAAVGKTLSCSQGAWTNDPTSYEYAWLRGTDPIATATGSTYLVQSADGGHELSCKVTATNGGGSTSRISDPVSIPAVPAPPANTSAPQLTGTPAVGQSLSCSQGAWTNAPTAFAFAWLRDGGAIGGAVASTYTVQGADQGHSLSCQVIATNAGGSTDALSNSLQVPAESNGGSTGGSPGGGGTGSGGSSTGTAAGPSGSGTASKPSSSKPKVLKCRKGFKKRKVHGKVKCVKAKAKAHKKRHG